MLDEFMEFTSDNSIKYMGNKELHILVPKYYEKFQMIKVDEDVVTLGIFEFWFDNETVHQQLFIPGVITTKPSEILYKVVGGDEYVYCTFRKGDTFIMNKFVVKSEFIAYALFSMYLEKGRIPNLITYDKEMFMFDQVAKVTGSNISSFPHSVFEIIYAHTARNFDNIQQFYRLTDMTKPPRRLKLSDLAHITTTLTAKLMSGYLASAIAVAINHENTNESPLEETLRQ